jgi:hypothetical protein
LRTALPAAICSGAWLLVPLVRPPATRLCHGIRQSRNRRGGRIRVPRRAPSYPRKAGRSSVARTCPRGEQGRSNGSTHFAVRWAHVGRARDLAPIALYIGKG